MMRRRRGVLLMLLLLVGWGLASGPTPAHACSCVEIPSPEIALQRSAAVFAGEVLSVRQKGPNLFGGGYAEHPIRVTFRVTETWKGVEADRLTVHTSMSTCGFDFDEGMRYIVYAYETSEGLATGLCTRTAELAKASDDLAALGKGKVPPSPEPDKRGLYLFPTGTVLACFSAVVLVIRLLRLRRRHWTRQRGKR
ncbi:hypothetical protein [Thermobacillus composti]|nr:hypothetical protein [Thermobacillus composti]